MKPWPPLVGTFTRSASEPAYPPEAQLDENDAWPLLMARSEPIADASLPDMRARSRPGTAIAAMMPMIATTISSSINVKPFALRIFITISFKPFISMMLRPPAQASAARHRGLPAFPTTGQGYGTWIQYRTIAHNVI